MGKQQLINFLTDEDMGLLEANAEMLSYKANAQIINQQNENTGVFWVRKGIVRVELSRLYQDIVVAGIGPGEMFGEMSFLMDDHKSTSAVVAHEDVEAMFIDRQALDKLLNKNDGLAARFYKTAAITLAQRLKSQTLSG